MVTHNYVKKRGGTCIWNFQNYMSLLFFALKEYIEVPVVIG